MLKCLGVAHPEEESQQNRTPRAMNGTREFAPQRLYQDPKCTFWRYNIEASIEEAEMRWEYHIPQVYQSWHEYNTEGITKGFSVCSVHESMRILFHSCNGFSAGTDKEEWHGCALWQDVLRIHEEKPFHVMIGGGDQIYNDGVRYEGPLRAWTQIKTPRKRREYKFGSELRAECDAYYFKNYADWWVIFNRE